MCGVQKRSSASGRNRYLTENLKKKKKKKAKRQENKILKIHLYHL